jgi:hypothetical protein
MRRRCRRGILGLLGLLLLELASLSNKRACCRDVVKGVTYCTGGTKVGDDRGILPLRRISRTWILCLRRLCSLTSVGRLGHGIPGLFTNLASFSGGSRNCTAKRAL